MRRFFGDNHVRQCGLETLRMFVTGGAAVLRRSRHTPARQHELTDSAFSVADDGSHLVGEDARKVGQIPGAVVLDAEQPSYCSLALGLGIKIAHRMVLHSLRSNVRLGSKHENN
jgi:hypothetical protein